MGSYFDPSLVLQPKLWATLDCSIQPYIGYTSRRTPEGLDFMVNFGFFPITYKYFTLRTGFEKMTTTISSLVKRPGSQWSNSVCDDLGLVGHCIQLNILPSSCKLLWTSNLKRTRTIRFFKFYYIGWLGLSCNIACSFSDKLRKSFQTNTWQS